jgi:glycine/sarcosine/dimethylglycine N-methyltransferase
MADILPNDQYRREYTPQFVSRWDDLIGWDGRAAGEAEFFERFLRAHGVRKVADIASGTGYHAITLARSGFEVTATDGAASMIEQTRENAKANGIELADVRVVEWQKLAKSFGPDSFDALVCLGNAFTHLFDHEARREALAAMFSVLRPGGLLLLDHRNYDRILEQGYSSKHKFYYTGDGVDVEPIEVSRTLVHFEYRFGEDTKHHLRLYPLKQSYMDFLLEDAGFVDTLTYGDFERPFERLDPDFIQHIAAKPRSDGAPQGNGKSSAARNGNGKPAGRSFDSKTGESPRQSRPTSDVVSITQSYYDGPADEIYREIWGENLHLGLFEHEGQDLQTAMRRSNERITQGIGLAEESDVLEVACGYGGLARFIAGRYGSSVLATNLSEREIAHGKRLNAKAGLADKVQLEWADYHELPYADGRFDYYFSQEAFLHAADKELVLSEARRVLRPGGRLVFTDILVRRDTPDDLRERVYERVNAPVMWDQPDYVAALERLGFKVTTVEDWSKNVAPTYDWVRVQLEKRRAEFERRIGKEAVERTLKALRFWVDSARQGYIGWLYVVADR